VAIARLDAAGVPDAGFGDGGRVLLDLGQLTLATEVAGADGGECWIAGHRLDPVDSSTQVFVARVDPVGGTVVDPVVLDLADGAEVVIGAASDGDALWVLRGDANGCRS
jgi:hypothetical protein